MPSGRSERQRRGPRGENSTGRRSESARSRKPGTQSGNTRTKPPTRSGGKSAARPRPKSNTGGAFRLSSTRGAAILALLVCAMTLSVAVPLRTYLSQRAELAEQRQKQAELVSQVEELRRREAKLSDPAHTEAEARRRLGYVRPGETAFIVQVPAAPAVPPPPPPLPVDTPWYEDFWSAITGGK